MATGRNISELKELLKKNAKTLQVTPKPKINDILVHCCVEDVAWVKQHLLIHVEHSLKRKCYLSYRDGINLGNDAVAAINEDIDSAANIILIISQDYVTYSWHNYYVKMAHRKSISEEIPLVVLFLGDVKKLVFPEYCQIQPFLMHHILVEWKTGPKDKHKDAFWKDIATKYLNNKSTCIRSKAAPRKEVVSIALREKAGFIHARTKTVKRYQQNNSARYRTTLEIESLIQSQMINQSGVKTSGDTMSTPEGSPLLGRAKSATLPASQAKSDSLFQGDIEGYLSLLGFPEKKANDLQRRSVPGGKNIKHRQNEVCYTQFSKHGWPMAKAYCCVMDGCTPLSPTIKSEHRHPGFAEIVEECLDKKQPIVEEIIQKSTEVKDKGAQIDTLLESLSF